MTTFSYPAFHLHQRVDGNGPAFLLFHAPVGEVAQWSDVERLGPASPRKVQREPVKSRISSIKRFFDKDPANTIPTAIVIALKDVQVADGGELVHVTIDTKDLTVKPGLIIDGQHRLRGMEAVDAGTRVAIVAVLEPGELEMAFQFLVINNKSAKVPRDHLRALALNYKEEELRTRLETARLSLDENVGSVGVLDEDDESPFRGLIKWPNNPAETRVVVPAAIEAIAGYAKSLGIKEIEESDGLDAFLMAMWRSIASEWAHVFNKGNHLLEKVGLICLTQFIGDTLKSWSRNPKLRVDFGDPDEIEANTILVLNTLDPAFFQADWSSASYDTRSGRDQIMQALETISSNITNGAPWYDGVTVLEKNWLEKHNATTGRLHAASV